MKPIAPQYGGPVLDRVGRTIASALLVVSVANGCAREVSLPADADAEIVTGHDVFGDRCARCHGTDGGGGIGPPLIDVDRRLSDDEQREIIRNGRRTMPRFDSVLTDEEIDAVVRYSREIL